MQTMTNKLQTYGVLYYEKGTRYIANSPSIFLCEADSSDHAEEQCVNAYPECTVMWVSLTDSNRELEQIEQTYDDYYNK
jgi:hypothetical protein